MSDRKRRWICRLFFVVMCLIPTGWFVARIRFQPSAEQWSQQLQLVLGLPLIVETVQTPNPDTIRLQQITWSHPEWGTISEIKNLEIQQAQVSTFGSEKWEQANVLPDQKWSIDRMTISEQGLEEFVQALHRQWFQMRQAKQLPRLVIEELFVVRPSGIPDVEDRLVARLGDLEIREASQSDSGESEAFPAALVIQGHVLPLTGGTLIGGVPRQQLASAPFQLRIQREAQGYKDYQTHWNLALLEPLPLNWLGFEQLPQVLVQQNFRVQGQFRGWSDRKRFSLHVRDTRLLGSESPTGELALRHLLDWVFGDSVRSFSQTSGADLATRSGAAAPLDGRAQLEITSAEFQAHTHQPLQLVSLDATLTATTGRISNRLLKFLQTELQNRVERPNSLNHFLDFDQLAIQLLARDNRIKLYPLPSQTPALISYKQQELLYAVDIAFPLKNFFHPGPSDRPYQTLCHLLPEPVYLPPTTGPLDAIQPDPTTRQATHLQQP